MIVSVAIQGYNERNKITNECSYPRHLNKTQKKEVKLKYSREKKKNHTLPHTKFIKVSLNKQKGILQQENKRNKNDNQKKSYQ